MTQTTVHAEMPTTASELTSSRTVADDGLRWHDNLESGWKEAKATGRPMVIFITSEQCVYCDAMKRDTLCDESIRKRLLSRFVPIRLRPGPNNRVLSRIDVPAYPTTLIAHPKGKVIAHRVGYQPVKNFHEMLSEVAPSEDSVLIR
ncbi:thioredoxin family protein [Rhodopirellula sallentina]|uniref:Protein disulfide-isomerase n=1 Tax=Rhodopirellula sallentina SM41 TaxID=1263870 RepID=M5U4S3_9BACT|nr:thioredoxin family protein [Rhodopirellula sallentina]EMI52856.1 protein disulfide-isomerase [Rhodopirellula sallentina SM41]